MKPLLIAHRGDTVNFPENTLDAFESAFAKGADGIELDVQFFQGNLIVVHNYLFESSKSYPHLSEVLKQFAHKGRIEIEIKSLDLEFLQPLKMLMHQYQSHDLEITTSIYPLVPYLRQEFPTSLLGFIFRVSEREAWMTPEFLQFKIIKLMQLMHTNIAHIPWQIEPGLVTTCHANGYKIHGHIAKQEMSRAIEEYHRMKKMGVDQCTIDDITLISPFFSLEQHSK